MTTGDDVRDRFPLLTTLFGGYLHQDYDDEHGSADGAVAAFVSETTAADRASFAHEVSALLGSYDESGVERTLEAMGNFYDYERDALTAHQWIRRIAERVTSRP